MKFSGGSQVVLRRFSVVLVLRSFSRGSQDILGRLSGALRGLHRGFQEFLRGFSGGFQGSQKVT